MTDERDDIENARRAAATCGGAAAGPDLTKLAHELRTPLSAIAVLSEIMRDERLGPLPDPRYRGYAADIHDSASHAMSVLASFIDPAEGGGAGGLPMDFVELDMSRLVTGVVSALVPLAERQGVRLELAGAAGQIAIMPHIIADRRSLRQILDNLVANALKFTPPGGGITVALTYAVGSSVQLSVADTGDGMTAVELDRARAGAMAPEPIRRRSGGTGYGLPLVRALSLACGAALAIDSAPGRGTTVTITFPHDRVVPV